MVCGPDPQRYIDRIQAFADAEFTTSTCTSLSPDQAGFFDFARRELLPHFGEKQLQRLEKDRQRRAENSPPAAVER